MFDIARLDDFRSPRSVIGYAVGACHRFGLNLRDVEDLLAAPGIIVSCETIRDWVARFGTQFAAAIRTGQPQPADKWHLDEVVIPIKDVKHWLWHAVDVNVDVLGILYQLWRNKAAAKHFLRKLFRRWGQPQILITDKLRAYTAAKTEITPGTNHRQHKALKNRAEASHRHTPRCEEVMGRFKSPR